MSKETSNIIVAWSDTISILIEFVSFLLVTVDLYGERRLNMVLSLCLEWSVKKEAKNIDSNIRFLSGLAITCIALVLMFIFNKSEFQFAKFEDPFEIVGVLLRLTFTIFGFFLAIYTLFFLLTFFLPNPISNVTLSVIEKIGKLTTSKHLKDKMILKGFILLIVSKLILIFKIWYFTIDIPA